MKPPFVNEAVSQCKNSYFSTYLSKTNVIAGTCGVLTFPAVIALFQNFVWKKVGVAAHVKLSWFYGISTVCISSAVSHVSTESVRLWQKNLPVSMISKEDIILYSVLSAGQFIVLARTFKVVLPSSLFFPGAYAKTGVMLKSKQYFSPVSHIQRNKIQCLGYRYGCHTCGKKYIKFLNKIKQLFSDSRIKVEYIADHQPPKAIVLSQKHCLVNSSYLYPQCFACSSQQAFHVRMSKNKYKSSLVTHGFRFKIWKLLIPWSLFFNFGDVTSLMIPIFELVMALFK